MAWFNFSDYKWTMAGTLAGIAYAWRQDYWLMFLPALGKENINPLENSGLILSNIVLTAFIGSLEGRCLDILKKGNEIRSKWYNLFDKKYTVGSAITGLAYAFRQDYWLLFLPAIGKESKNDLENAGLIISNMLFTAFIIGIGGRCLDILARLNATRETEHLELSSGSYSYHSMTN